MRHCHYPDFCTKGAFLSSRSDGLNLAVGFNLVFNQNMSIYGWSPFDVAPSVLSALRLTVESVTLKQLSERRGVRLGAAKLFRFASNPRK